MLLSSTSWETFLSNDYLVLDFETYVEDGAYGNPVDPRNNLALACWKTAANSGRVRAKWGSEYEQSKLLDAIERADFIVCHNAKYELGWLYRCGIDLSNILVFDTKIAEYVLYGNLVSGDFEAGVAPVSTSLADCCVRYGLTQKDPIVDMWMKDGINVRDMPPQWVTGRCATDVLTTEKLFLLQRQKLLDTKRLPVLYTRCIITPVLADTERCGVHLDSDRVNAAHAEYTERLVTLEAEFDALAGGINWRSPKQVADLLYDKLGFEEIRDRRGEPKRTKTGVRKADKKTLDKLRAVTPEQKAFIELKNEIGKVGSALSKNLNYFQGICKDYGGTFHAEFNQTRTATHRLSSSGIPNKYGSVQLQNLPRAFKRLFTARREDMLMFEADGSQLEFRVAAFLGNDPQAKADIDDPTFDVHILSGSAMARRDYYELLEAYKAGDKRAIEIRQAAKSETFKPLYGGKVGTPEQERWYRTFAERYHALAETQKTWISRVLKDKELITPWGLRYYWPHASINNNGHVNCGTQVSNYPIQGLATAEIIPIALRYFWDRTRGYRDAGQLLVVNTVHDSVQCEIDAAIVDDIRQVAKRAFTLDVYEYLERIYGLRFDVPLGCGIKVGKFLGEGTEVSYNVYRDGREQVK